MSGVYRKGTIQILRLITRVGIVSHACGIGVGKTTHILNPTLTQTFLNTILREGDGGLVFKSAIGIEDINQMNGNTPSPDVRTCTDAEFERWLYSTPSPKLQAWDTSPEATRKRAKGAVLDPVLMLTMQIAPIRACMAAREAVQK